MKIEEVFLPIVLLISCSQRHSSGISPLPPQTTYNIAVDNNQVGYETIKREQVHDTIIVSSTQERPFRLRPITYESKLILAPGVASSQVVSYRCFEELPGQRISFRLKYEKPWIILLQNSVVSSPRYYNSDPKDPDGPAIIEWDRALLIEILVNRYILKDSVWERVQEIPVIIPSAFGEWGGAAIELTRLKGDTAEFRIVYRKEIEKDSMLFWGNDSVYAIVRTIMRGDGRAGTLLQSRVVLPSGVTLSIFEDSEAPLTLAKPKIFSFNPENYKIEEAVFSGSDGVRLSGSLYLPISGDNSPGVLFIHSSAAVDRREMGVFSSLAHKLASTGSFAVLTYDKRGTGNSEGSYDSLHWGVLASDAALALDHLMSTPGVDTGNVFIIGHGEGALIAFDLASDPAYKDRIKGVVSLGATSLNPVDSGNIEMLVLQAIERQWSEERLRKQIEDLELGLENLRNTDEYWTEIAGFPGERENLAYARSLLDFEPLEKIGNSNCYFLFLHGEEDQFVSPDNASKLFESSSARNLTNDISKLVLLPGLDANFAFPTIEGKDGYVEYFKLPEDAGEEISLSDTIYQWILEALDENQAQITEGE
ncbi:alpha/beta fold hydrolase [candidate division WOR-3 bacterium]|nr:alpha/beta fold hydrolase [candidate division WOR-3 bacterium]